MWVITILYVLFMLLVNITQLVYIKRYINISPFSKKRFNFIILTYFFYNVFSNKSELYIRFNSLYFIANRGIS